MLARTSLVCRQCLTNKLHPSLSLRSYVKQKGFRKTKKEMQNIRGEEKIFPVSRNKKEADPDTRIVEGGKFKLKLPDKEPEIPEHLKIAIMGHAFELDPSTKKIRLTEIEERNRRERKHWSGYGIKRDLYKNSIHGKAEFLSRVMRSYDRVAMQREYHKSGALRFNPNAFFYHQRAYGIMKGLGGWEKLTIPDEQIFDPNSLRRKPKWSRWVAWPYRDADPFGERSVPPEVVEANFRKFLQKFTVLEGSDLAEQWSKKDMSLDLRNGPGNSQKFTTSQVDQSVGLETAISEPAISEEDVKSLKAARKPDEKVLPAEPVLEEEAAEIWRPNQKDHALRQSTFSHPSQTTLAQATKQLRSSWAPRTFYDMNLIKGLPDAIEKVTLGHLNKSEIKPTEIQALAIQIITKLDSMGFGDSKAEHTFRSFLIASETGSGKTLAFLIPLINRLKREEEWALRNPTSSRSIFNTHRAASPRALIIVPTSELAEQIYNILKRLSHEIKFTVCALLPKFEDSVVRKSILSKYIDILVSTPHRLNEFIQSGEIHTNMTRYLIIDEADTIFDRSFVDSLTPILDAVKLELTHLILCTATIPLALEEKLHSKFPGMQRLVAPKIHTAPRRIKFELVLETDKREALLTTLTTIKSDNTEPSSDVKRAIVFCNGRTTVREVYEYLKSAEDIAKSQGRESSFELIPFTRDNYDRHTALERFNERDETNSKKLRILITTDMGSRGLDTMSAKTAVLYDVPYSLIDLLHRLGRIGRAGTRGRAFMIVSKEEYRGPTKEWVDEIRDRLIRGEALV